jgi:hypothetical protein
MRTLRAAALAATRWIFAFSRFVLWLTRIVAAIVVWTTMVFGASFTTVALYFPEDSLTPLWVEFQASPLSAYSRWSAAVDDDDDGEFWVACLADRDCVDRVCSVDIEREDMQADMVEQIAGVAARP